MGIALVGFLRKAVVLMLRRRRFLGSPHRHLLLVGAVSTMGQGCIGRGGKGEVPPPLLQGALPCPPDGKCQAQWHCNRQ